MPAPRHLVLGTAGHIDHGKSALVERLTGTNPDRLEEERRRGITIELGFADLELSDARVVSFVDVPGHERFVRHMVAGASGVGAVMLVVAADQGVQPQTREHLSICSLLGLSHGLVALTKCDLVDGDLAGVARLEVEEVLAGTFLEGSPVVAVSARTGTGIDELRAELGALFERVPEPFHDGVPRLAVDRSFVLRGFGTVVTGTLVGGALREGDEVEVLPGGRRGRVRGLQTHGRAVTDASPGRRTAVNLQGLDAAEVPRGATLTPTGALRTTRRLRGRVTLVPGAPERLRRGGPVRFHHGTAEGAARLRVFGAEDDGTLRAELVLAREVAAAPGDRFVLRRPAPLDTVGGGVVLDTRPPRRAPVGPEEFSTEALDPARALRRLLVRAGGRGRDAADVARELGLPSSSLEPVARRLRERGELVAVRSRWIDGGIWREAGERLVEALDAFHREQPLRLGAPRELLRPGVAPRLPQEAWRQLLEELAASGSVTIEGDLLARAGHAVRLDAEAEAAAARLESVFRQAGLEPPDPASAIAAAGEGAAGLLDLLIARARLVRIHDGKVFHADALASLRSRLAEHARSSPTIDVGAFKELAGVSRKHAIPLLEHLDAIGATRRRGNTREILG